MTRNLLKSKLFILFHQYGVPATILYDTETKKLECAYTSNEVIMADQNAKNAFNELFLWEGIDMVNIDKELTQLLQEIMCPKMPFVMDKETYKIIEEEFGPGANNRRLQKELKRLL